MDEYNNIHIHPRRRPGATCSGRMDGCSAATESPVESPGDPADRTRDWEGGQHAKNWAILIFQRGTSGASSWTHAWTSLVPSSLVLTRTDGWFCLKIRDTITRLSTLSHISCLFSFLWGPVRLFDALVVVNRRHRAVVLSAEAAAADAAPVPILLGHTVYSRTLTSKVMGVTVTLIIL